ncbi:hypothetical protein PR202_gb11110 [Eleusine coracana subsp. coracana]|uniref:E3 ubiquitin-protein ligase FANCL n=1 Tax=Eleusine coracana subsp. coracana TaxID=191504 RepID=A0AAV5EM40_ELECO|nr:hypothetical protein PR202_gb11110 [Eleusine coracana subsp. coracana]
MLMHSAGLENWATATHGPFVVLGHGVRCAGRQAGFSFLSVGQFGLNAALTPCLVSRRPLSPWRRTEPRSSRQLSPARRRGLKLGRRRVIARNFGTTRKRIQGLRRSGRQHSTAPCSRRDDQGRVHLLDITLPMDYPSSPPLIAADIPYLPKIQWSKRSKLKDVFCQFQEHLKTLQEFWSTMDEIDKVLWVVDPAKPTHAMSHRRIALGDDCYILLNVNARKPSSLPEDEKKKFHENLAAVLDVSLPAPPSLSTCNDDEQADCGICYAKHLPVDDELGVHSGCATDYTCENSSCSRAFHSFCLRDWLRSITTTRQSYDVLFGNCPYCSDPVAVKVTDR